MCEVILCSSSGPKISIFPFLGTKYVDAAIIASNQIHWLISWESKGHDIFTDLWTIPEDWACGLSLVDPPSWTVPCGPSLVDRALWTVPNGPSLVDRPLWTVPLGSATHGALKTRGCSGLDSLTVPVDRPQGLDLWTVPHGSATCGALKTRGCSGLDSLAVPKDWTRGPSLLDRPSWTVPRGSAMRGTLKTGRCSKSDRNFLFSFLTQCYYPHTSRESVSPVCGIFSPSS